MKKIPVLLLLAAAFAAHAEVSFSYQGVLRGASGEAVVDRNKTIAFRLYTDPTSTAAVWGRQVAVFLDEEGLFNVELSDSDAAGSPIDGLDATLEEVLARNADTPLYIGLTVSGSSGEIQPRPKLLAVPVAAVAQDVQHAKGNFTVDGNATIQSGLVVGGRLTTQSLTVNGATSLVGDVTLAGDLLVNNTSALIPAGVIVMWSGSVENIPDGWALCNGQGKTPDLTDRFIVGAGSGYGVGDRGGEATHTLPIAEMPSHSHTNVFDGADLGASWDSDNYFYTTWAKYTKNANTVVSQKTGGNAAHENRPPYYALCFIMKL